MADWTDLSSNFGYGTKLTSALQQQLRDNITAAMEGASGSPGLGADTVDSSQIVDGAVGASHIASGGILYTNIASGQITDNHLAANSVSSGHIIVGAVQTAHVANNAITTAKIDFDTVSMSLTRTDSGISIEHFLLPGGEYHFMPSFKVNSYDHTSVRIGARFICNSSTVSEVMSDSSLTYTSILALEVFTTGNDITLYSKSAYITASGQLKWIFIKREKTTGSIVSTYEAWDHPSNMNNPNIEHPFIFCNPFSYEIICINPTSSDLCYQEDLLDMGLDEVDALLQADITIDNTLKFPSNVLHEEKIVNHRRRIKPVKNKLIKASYIPEPTKTNIKLARIKFK